MDRKGLIFFVVVSLAKIVVLSGWRSQQPTPTLHRQTPSCNILESWYSRSLKDLSGYLI